MTLPLAGTVQKEVFYCLICGGGSLNGDVTQQHVQQKHDEVPVQGDNFAQGWQVEQIRSRFLEEAKPRTTVFVKALRQPGYGADDFLLDCGTESKWSY